MSRMSFVKSLEEQLVTRYDQNEVAIISNFVIKALEPYEITERCTEIAIRHDDINERLERRYSACLMIDGKSDKTIYQYIRIIRKLSDMLNKPYTEMGAYDIRYFLAKEQERGVSSSTLENNRSNLRAFFQWMATEEIIPKNPMLMIKPIKCPSEIKEPFSEVELDALRGSCKSKKERALIEMLISTGVRVSELASMNVEDVNLTTLAVHVLHGKGAKERLTYTTSLAAKHLVEYLNNREDVSPSLFCNKNHERINSGGIRFVLNSIAKRANVQHVHPHRFRRTFATNLAKRGMDIQEIQRLLGHSNLNTTMIYVVTDDTRTQAAYKRFTA